MWQAALMLSSEDEGDAGGHEWQEQKRTPRAPPEDTRTISGLSSEDSTSQRLSGELLGPVKPSRAGNPDHTNTDRTRVGTPARNVPISSRA